MKKIVFLSLNLLWTTFVAAQVVNIPDVSFKKELVSKSFINTNGDGEIQVSEAVAYTGGIVVNFKGIKDLTGIEAFVNITSLNCGINSLTTLDVSKNVALTKLFCYNNKISTLDVSNNVALEDLECNANDIKTINLNNNIALKHLNCSNNVIKDSLNVSKNVMLEELICANNSINVLDLSKNIVLKKLLIDSNLLTLDVSNNINLTYLSCNQNSIKTLDISKNIALTELNCPKNDISVLDVSNNINLIYLNCRKNKLSNLNVSKNIVLKYLDSSENTLVSLNVKNGANNLLTSFNATFNPLLKCIEVDNPNATLNTWKKDSTASYSSNCMIPTKDISSESFLQLYPNPSTESFAFSNLTEAPLSVAIYDLHGKLVQHYPIPASNYDISTLCNGLYIVKAQFATGEAIAKLLKGE